MIAQVVVDVVHTNVAKPFSYTVPDGMTLTAGSRVRVPLGRRQVDGVVVALTDTTDVPPERLKPVIQSLEKEPALLAPLLALAQELAEQCHCPLAETLRLMLPAAMRTGRIQMHTESFAQLGSGVNVHDAAAAQGRSQKRATLLRLLADGEAHAVTELAEWVNAPRDALKQLAADGWINLFDREICRSPYEEMPVQRSMPPTLTAEQQEALSVMRPALERGEGAFLLHGVTGSGKTEVYLALVQRALELGKSAIVLVPEIALTPQMVLWFRNRFGPETAVLHSRLTDGQRYDEWRRIRRGEARVAIGARSAVFAPIEHLGLIVVDEEHEQTYLSDKHPRYDARRVAQSRCLREGATLVLSSATPSILSFAMARRGDYTLVEMPHRVNHRPLPAVTVVDMRKELDAGNRSIFSQLLQQKLADCLSRGQQAMLFLNRRGYNTFVSCRSCGQVIKCPNCDVAMTYHVQGGDGLLHCHYCGNVCPPPATCPKCGSRYIRFFGAGTQKVEEELKRLFPDVGVVRMDIDTTSGKDGHERLLDVFRSGRAKILVGTQMIAKGLDFPRVTLVGVVAADMTLNLPDYRAPERTFQLLTQVAGRAGRGVLPGRVVIQTYKPEDPVILAASRQDYRAFFEEEFERRRQRLYPPFTIMARLLVESGAEEAAREKACELNRRVEDMLARHPLWKKRVLLCQLDQPSVTMLRGKSRWHILFKLLVRADEVGLTAALSDLAREETPGVDVWFEYNPTNMM